MTASVQGPPTDAETGWFVPLPGPDDPDPSPVKIVYRPLEEGDGKPLPPQLSSLIAVDIARDEVPEGVRLVGPVAGFFVKTVAQGVTWKLIEKGAGYLLATPNVNPADRPQVLYSTDSQMTFHLQPDGTYRPSGVIQF